MMRKSILTWLLSGALCATAVSCNDPSAPRLEPNTPAGLRVWVEVTPRRLSMSDPGATARVRIVALNPGPDTIRLAGGPPYVFAPDPVDSRSLEQSLRIGRDANTINAGPGVDYWGQLEYVFPPAARDVAEYTLSLKAWVEGGWPLAPGVYRMRGYFNGMEGAEAELTIVR